MTPLVYLTAVAVYLGVGLILGKIAALRAYNFDGSTSRSDIEFRTYLWLWLTFFIWPFILAGAVPFFLITTAGRIIHRIALPQELTR